MNKFFGNNFSNISQREYVEYGASTAVFNGKNAIFALLRRLITQRSTRISTDISIYHEREYRCVQLFSEPGGVDEKNR